MEGKSNVYVNPMISMFDYSVNGKFDDHVSHRAWAELESINTCCCSMSEENRSYREKFQDWCVLIGTHCSSSMEKCSNRSKIKTNNHC